MTILQATPGTSGPKLHLMLCPAVLKLWKVTPHSKKVNTQLTRFGKINTNEARPGILELVPTVSEPDRVAWDKKQEFFRKPHLT